MHLLRFETAAVSDARDTTFGIRKVTYGPRQRRLTISVNGVKVFMPRRRLGPR
jgi:hypothetical protein